jgi:hypothetical protein
VRLQIEEQRREHFDTMVRELDGLKLAISHAKYPVHFTDAALALRRWFCENPEMIRENSEFFGTYLAPLVDSVRPSDAYWTDERILGFSSEAQGLRT